MIRTISWALFVVSLCSALLAEDALQRNATVAYENTPLADVFKDLQAKTGVRVAFAQELITNAEPITFSAQNMPTGKILREILWPRGFEIIRTEGELLALVPVASDRGGAKQFGAALRTFVWLEAKLEKAQTKGDQVIVPEWTDEDEVALARAVFDMISSVIVLADRTTFTKTWDDIEALAQSRDPDVRAGSVLLLEAARELRFSQRAQARTYLRKLAEDKDEIAAGVGLVALYEIIHDEDPALLKKYASDPRATLRAAARMAAAFGRHKLPPAPNESSGAIRFIDHVCELNQLRRPYAPAFQTLLGKIEREPNPIVQAILLGLMGIMKADAPNEMLAPEGFSSLFEKAGPWVSMLAARIDEGFAPDLKSIEKNVALLTSLRQSDQTVGLALAFGKVGFRKFPNLKDRNEMTALMKALQPILTLNKSSRTTMRLVGAIAAGLLPGAPPQPFVDALQSNDPVLRVPAIATVVEVNPPANVDAKGVGNKALASALPLEALAGAEIIAKRGAGDDLLDTVIAAIQKSPNSLLAAALGPRLFHARLSDAQGRKLVDALLASKANELICRLAYSNSLPDFDQKFLPDLLARAEPPALLGISTAQEHAIAVRAELSRVWIRRIDELMRSEDSSLRIAAIRVFASVVMRGSILYATNHPEGAETRRAFLQTMEQMIARSLKAEDSAEAEAAFDAFGNFMTHASTTLRPEEPLPEWISTALETVIDRLPQATFAERSAGPIARMANDIRRGRFKHLNALSDKVEKAKALIENGASEAARWTLLTTLASAQDKAANAALTKMLMEGKVPPENYNQVLSSVHIDTAPPEYAEWLLKIVVDPASPSTLRHNAMSVLSDPQTLPRLLKASAELYRTKKDLLRDVSFYATVHRLRLQPNIPAEALAAARELGRDLMNDSDARLKREGATLYAASLSGDAVTGAADLLLDEKSPVDIRTALAASLRPDKALEPEFKKLLDSYDKLPQNIRDALGQAAARTPSESASRFLAKWLRDDKAQKFTRAASLAVVETVRTDELLAALTTLKGDPNFNFYVEQLLKKWTPTDPPAVAPPPPAGDF
ncbi:MAG TPA: hypothetical protein VEK08_15495 [Planctomycetota bacterium]|nr:hypothetical protein [Planctomycetota bacterium]